MLDSPLGVFLGIILFLSTMIVLYVGLGYWAWRDELRFPRLTDFPRGDDGTDT